MCVCVCVCVFVRVLLCVLVCMFVCVLSRTVEHIGAAELVAPVLVIAIVNRLHTSDHFVSAACKVHSVSVTVNVPCNITQYYMSNITL